MWKCVWQITASSLKRNHFQLWSLQWTRVSTGHGFKITEVDPHSVYVLPAKGYNVPKIHLHSWLLLNIVLLPKLFKIKVQLLNVLADWKGSDALFLKGQRKTEWDSCTHTHHRLYFRTDNMEDPQRVCGVEEWTCFKKVELMHMVSQLWVSLSCQSWCFTLFKTKRILVEDDWQTIFVVDVYQCEIF